MQDPRDLLCTSPPLQSPAPSCLSDDTDCSSDTHEEHEPRTPRGQVLRAPETAPGAPRKKRRTAAAQLWLRTRDLETFYVATQSTERRSPVMSASAALDLSTEHPDARAFAAYRKTYGVPRPEQGVPDAAWYENSYADEMERQLAMAIDLQTWLRPAHIALDLVRKKRAIDFDEALRVVGNLMPTLD
jgi:hypothetical protein